MRLVQPKGVLEFGVNVGRTAHAILEHVPSIERYEGVDVPPGYVTAAKVQRGEVPIIAGEMVLHDPRFKLLLSPNGSHDLTPNDLSPCNAAFIDGDHSMRGVLHDTMLASTLVRPGGIIIWHDYHDLGTVDVRDALHALHYERPDMQLRHVEGTWIVYSLVPLVKGS